MSLPGDRWRGGEVGRRPRIPLAKLIEGDSRARFAGVLVGWLVNTPLVGSWVGKALRAANRLPFVRTRVTPFHAWLLRRAGGRLRRSWLFAAGQPVMSLTTTGRRSGEPRSTVVTCFTYGDDLAVAAMNLGAARNPSWAWNLEANPEAIIELEGEAIPVTARKAEGDEAARWRRWVDVQPSAIGIRDLTGRDIPLFVLSHRRT